MNTTTQAHNNPFHTDLRAFHGDPALKEAMLAEVEAHRQADAIIQGCYWDVGADNPFGGRGCAVGCSIDSYNRLRAASGVLPYAHEDHGAYESALGVPRALARLEDALFEGMPQEEARRWPGRFLEAIPVGADLSLLLPRFFVWLLGDEADGVIRFAKTDRQREGVERVVTLYHRVLEGDVISVEEWRAAYVAAAAAAAYGTNAADAAAYVAADAAAYVAAAAAAYVAAAAAANNGTNAADAAAYAAAAYGTNAAYVAAAAAAAYGTNAADAAAYVAAAADAAAAVVGRQRHHVTMADKLLTLLRGAPVPALEAA